jgi:hypothetical protein
MQLLHWTGSERSVQKILIRNQPTGMLPSLGVETSAHHIEIAEIESENKPVAHSLGLVLE